MKWRKLPASFNPKQQARAWWGTEYHRHIDAGFSDVDARVMVAHIADHKRTTNQHIRQVAHAMERR